MDVTEANGEETAKNATQWVKNVIEECMITKADTVKLILELFYTCYLRTKSSDRTMIKELAQEIHSKIVVNTLCKEKLASSLPMPLSARKYYLLLLRTLLVVYNLGKINVEFVFALGFAQILT